MGEAAHDRGAVAGETPNLAARLQHQADAGQVLVDPNTRQLIGETFELVELGPQALKGYDDLVLAWHVVGKGSCGKPFRRDTPFCNDPLCGP